MIELTVLLQVLIAMVLTMVLGANFSVGMYLVANHTWKDDKGQTKGLLWVGIRQWLEKFLITLDNIKVLRIFRLLGIPLTTLLILTWFVTNAIKTADLNYLWGLSLSVAFSASSKSFRDLGEMFLSCFRCMPTFWIGIPLVLTFTLLGFYIDTAYFIGYPLTIFTIAGISFLSAYLYMLYAEAKTKKDLNPKMTKYYENAGYALNIGVDVANSDNPDRSARVTMDQSGKIIDVE